MKLWATFVIILLAALPVYGAGPDDILGYWTTEKGDVKLEFFRCGKKICGKIVGLDEPVYLDSKDGPVGETKTDRKNPDPALRKRPILGLQVMKGVAATGRSTWGGGACYDPQSGKNYKCKMKLVSPDKLEMRGFIGMSLFGRNYVLVR
ncbi:DUF2147 domain-containing protein [Geobacter sp. DSM 9736]|uniref:DUF2147 domain-containing protein n=1 Tax=Geobacter sp. DSM 9736 TaxID=1277350 RepID=UPI000B60B021|nr:DUF2147 domain-containing protein [Geobacter sp. DSM 9736]SNB47438.1 hypothetical protein SAMN06269301_2927 [Geobacter sp. DSM 9736]